MSFVLIVVDDMAHELIILRWKFKKESLLYDQHLIMAFYKKQDDPYH